MMGVVKIRLVNLGGRVVRLTRLREYLPGLLLRLRRPFISLRLIQDSISLPLDFHPQ
jgi:hypothetical protein